MTWRFVCNIDQILREHLVVYLFEALSSFALLVFHFINFVVLLCHVLILFNTAEQDVLSLSANLLQSLLGSTWLCSMQIQAVTTALLVRTMPRLCCFGWSWWCVRREKSLHWWLWIIEIVIESSICYREGLFFLVSLKVEWLWMLHQSGSFAVTISGCGHEPRSVVTGAFTSIAWVAKRSWLSRLQVERFIFLKWYCKVTQWLIVVKRSLQKEQSLEEKDLARVGLLLAATYRVTLSI